MPCSGDYLNPRGLEIPLSEVYCFLAELKGDEWEPHWLKGYHPMVYSKGPTKEQLDTGVRALCGVLKGMTKEEIRECSLELQIWWRDHQKADRERES